MLASQLESGTFVQGLWYFFGIVLTAGIFSGVAGLGLGFTAGVVWEQIHRHRRSERLKRKAMTESESSPSHRVAEPQRIAEHQQTPRLQLVGNSIDPLPDLAGRRLRSVRFLENAVELDFGGIRIALGAHAVVSCGPQKHRYPEPGSRDAMCDLIGSRVDRIRAIAGDRVEISCDNGCDLTVLRSGLAVA